VQNWTWQAERNWAIILGVSLVPLVSPTSEEELVTTLALLRAYGIPTHVRGGGFGSLLPGPLLAKYNAKTILVPEELLSDARELLAAPAALPDDDEPDQR